MINQSTCRQGLFLLLTIIIFSSCQNQPLTLVDSYVGSTKYFGMDIVPLGERGSIIATQEGTLIRLTNETENNVLWEKKITDEKIKSIVADKNDVIVLTEQYTLHINGRDTTTTNHLKIIKVSDAGDIKWEVIDSSMAEVRADKLVSLGNGKFGISGVIKSISTNERLEHRQMLALTLNSSGKIIWKKTFKEYKEIGAISYQASELDETSDGGMIMTWITRFKVRDDYYPEGFCVFKLDKDGNLVWKKQMIIEELFPEEVGDFVGTITQLNIVKDSQGEFMMVGESRFGSWAMKLDANGEILWKKILGLNHLFHLTDLVGINDNLFIINSSIMGEGQKKESSINLVGLDGQGNVLWENKDKIEERSNGYALAKGFNNDIYVVGGTLTGESYLDSWRNNIPLIMRHYKINDLENEKE